MFTVVDRERIADRLIQRGREASRVDAGAYVGSSEIGGVRWSDIDLAFAVDDTVPIQTVLDGWTISLLSHSGVVELLHHLVGPVVSRVFLFPRMLQVGLSVAPPAEFMSHGPRFRPLFGLRRWTTPGWA